MRCCVDGASPVTTTDSLPVPDASRRELRMPDGREERDNQQIRAIAAPVVAAELRRLAAGEFGGAGGAHARSALLSRADELERK